MSTDEFTELEQTLATVGIDAALERLAQRLKIGGKYHDLFDARLMQARRKLGLPIILTANLDDLAEPLRAQVEDAYLAACREVGWLLLDAKRVRESWMYLRTLGENAAVAERLAAIEPSEDNLEELIEVALNEGVSPVLGFRLVLETYGTCNAITLYESTMAGRNRTQQQQAAGLLVRHLHAELVENVRADIAEQSGAQPPETTLKDLVNGRDWLFADDNYHTDTTHLAAIVRFARTLEESAVLRLALDLTEYGRRLSEQYQFTGEEPFADIYPSHSLYFHALLGEQVEAAVEFFRGEAQSIDVAERGTGAVEAYVALLARLKHYSTAIEALASLLPSGTRTSGQAPSLLELSRLAGDYRSLLATCRERGDLVAFTAGLVEQAVGGAHSA